METGKGMFALPGGFINGSETSAMCAERNVWKKTRLSLPYYRKDGNYELVYDDMTGKGKAWDHNTRTNTIGIFHGCVIRCATCVLPTLGIKTKDELGGLPEDFVFDEGFVKGAKWHEFTITPDGDTGRVKLDGLPNMAFGQVILVSSFTAKHLLKFLE